jgi:hypothetical protein
MDEVCQGPACTEPAVTLLDGLPLCRRHYALLRGQKNLRSQRERVRKAHQQRKRPRPSEQPEQLP